MDEEKPKDVDTPFYLSTAKPTAKELHSHNLEDVPFRVIRFLNKSNMSNDKGALYMYHNEDAVNETTEAELSESADRISFPYFDKREGQIHRIGVVGLSGSGKSFTIGLVLDQMIENKPKPYNELTQEDEFRANPFYGRIIIFSNVNDDDPLDRLRRGSRPIRIKTSDPDLMRYTVHDFQDCIVVFDDVEHSANVKTQKFILNLRTQMLQESRHYNCDIITVSHNILGGHLNNIMKSEITGLFLYPQYNQHHTSNSYLSNYCGLSKQQIKEIMSKKSRWVYINRITPQYYVWQKGIELIKREQ